MSAIPKDDLIDHGYFDVDLDIIWAILQNDLPPLIVQLEQVLPVRRQPRRH